MLDLLREDKPMQVRDILQRGVNYDRDKPGPVARAELVYHLLMLGRSRNEIDMAWLPGVEYRLRASLPEVPESMRPYLAARLGATLDSSLQSELDLSDIEAKMSQRIRDLLLVNKPHEAVAVARQHTERSVGSVVCSRKPRPSR